MIRFIRIYKSDRGIWHCETEYNGVRRWHSLHTRDEAEARRKAGGHPMTTQTPSAEALDPDLWIEACRIYGFAAGVDPLILTEHQEAIINRAYAALDRLREAERERCEKIVRGAPFKEHYRQWPAITGTGEDAGSRGNDSELTQWCDRLADLIRNRDPA